MKKLVFKTPNELIQHMAELEPITTYKTSEEEVKRIAANTTKLLNKHFGKLYYFSENISSSTTKPPFTVSWTVINKEGKAVHAK